MVIRGGGAPSLLPGPQLPFRGPFQYPANMDGGSGTFCTLVRKTQGGCEWAFDTTLQESDHR